MFTSTLLVNYVYFALVDDCKCNVLEGRREIQRLVMKLTSFHEDFFQTSFLLRDNFSSMTTFFRSNREWRLASFLRKKAEAVVERDRQIRDTYFNLESSFPHFRRFYACDVG
ncbi:uncharacterized protein LOC122531276 isoform X2 [Frieseomelitta varia]|uniref:uncharacterized protein LOC122531276 isoform X2 n=1 Tax=Frieseomelitta varia TaxID=561572 RepID=UPI001CB695E3|nr:uncharacterized protein LOC122531276 isoform X2 [Frieseomelitta varia]